MSDDKIKIGDTVEYNGKQFTVKFISGCGLLLIKGLKRGVFSGKGSTYTVSVGVNQVTKIKSKFEFGMLKK
jgi:hypothetical protein